MNEAVLLLALFAFMTWMGNMFIFYFLTAIYNEGLQPLMI